MEVCATWKVRLEKTDIGGGEGEEDARGPARYYRYAKTWVDTTQIHVVALLLDEEAAEAEHQQSSSTSSSLSPARSPARRRTSSSTKKLTFHILPIPTHPKTTKTNDLVDEVTLTEAEEVSIHIPRSLILDRDEQGRGDNGSPPRRQRPNNNITTIPLFAKFSLDRNLLALQVSSTCVRIVVVDKKNYSQQQQHVQHWTIELASGDPNPISTAPDGLIKFQYSGSMRNLREENRILPDGIIWSDHGGRSQDFTIISTKAVLCYKISLRRNQCQITHSFRNPDASVVLINPETRTACVGSYGSASMMISLANEDDGITTATTSDDGSVLYLRSFFLHFARKPPELITKGLGLALPRFELPPPLLLPIFPVGISRIEKGIRDKAIALHEVALVALYGQAYVVELGWCWENMELNLNFHLLDRTAKKVRMKTCTIKVNDIKDDGDSGGILPKAIIGVIDNLLCLSFPILNLQTFHDVSDEFDDPVITVQVEPSLHHHSNPILRRPQISFIAPGLLIDPTDEEGSIIYSLGLDIDTLSNKIVSDTDAVSLLARRSSPSAHRLALERISKAIWTSGATADGRQYKNLQELIERIAVLYSRHKEIIQAQDLTSHSLLLFDTMKDEFNCGLQLGGRLPSYRHSTRLAAGEVSPRAKSRLSITQKDILDRVLLPGFDTADISKLERLLHVSSHLATALTHHGCRPCVSLMTFTLALLWKLGQGYDVLYMVQACVYSYSSIEAEQLAKMVWLIITTLSPLTNQRNMNNSALLSARIMDAIEPLLANNPILRISYYLQRRQGLRAMSECTHLALLDERHRKPKLGSAASRSDLAKARVLFRGEDFFAVALEMDRRRITTAKQLDKTGNDPSHLLQSLYSFLLRWNPRCMERRESLISATYQRRILDQEEGEGSFASSSSRLEHLMKRRPSWISSTIVEKQSSLINRDSRESTLHVSRLAVLFPKALDVGFPGLAANDRLYVKKLFGYV